MILDIYKDSFEFASRKVSSLLLLGVLSFFSFLIIPAIFFYGYNYNVVKLSTQSMINGEDVPPEFSNFKEMFINGLKYIVVFLAYAIIPIIIFCLSLVTGDSGWIFALIGFILIVLSILFAYLAIAHMASNDDSLKSAFAFSEILNIMSSIGYFRYFIAYLGILIISVIVVLVVSIILGIVFAFLGIATSGISANGLGTVSTIGSILINFILFFIVMPYLTMFQSRCVGLIYNLGS
ncbi:DUF4013 domain-containing protein [Methanobrevibacter millerae]|uniref:DUF4013 domain-containing protein n=1 Tax=Methanobrevibacter millerae TaxID=230361 RepID=A0A1G5X0R5_9EURY|nr:DUF4013 domain-containing protein [Methanobrevibacter millerae]SDA63800.1 Protein of unknown function [Methanobrevibacter millerae]